MAYSYIRYTGNGTQTDFSFAFPYFSTSNISVTVNGTAAPFTWVNSSTVKITTAPASGAVIFIQRTTPKDITPVNFVDGSVLLEADLDTLALFSLYAAQESIDEANKAIKLNSSGNWEAQGNRINNAADPVSDQDVATKKWSETGMTAQLSIATNQASAASGSATAAASSAAASSASATSSAASASTATTKAAEASSSAAAGATSATNAAASASTASTKAAEASTSATTATTKASEAASSATTANTAAGSANTSATAAAGSATAASNSASGAAASATTATTKAAEASSSATSAGSSASTATGAASTATTKATEAATSATNAANSAIASASSASSAATSASTATTQATNAASSASAANTSAVSAASSAASAAALLDNFDDRYLGAKSSAPSVDNDGNALQLGALYFDSTTGKMRVYTASGWLDASSASVATLAVFNYTATAGQTSFSGADIAGQTLTYTVGSLFVTLNGIDLKNGTDYTATTGSSIVLASGAVTGDELRVYAFGSFLVADTYTRAQADAAFQPVNSNLTAYGATGVGMRNRIINGDMRIAQRSTASISVQTSAQYVSIDRWGVYNTQNSKCTVQQNAGSVTPPVGFTNYLGITSSSAYSPLAGDIMTAYQVIEGYNIADFGWGTAAAKPITLSFQVYSSLTGTFGGSLQNVASNRAYPFTYSIPVANTWTTITVNIQGDTSGTWNTTNGAGIQLFFNLGTGSTYSGAAGSWSGAVGYFSATGSTNILGTSGATWYVTGVQLEKGSVATPFEYRPFGTELALCQRYYQVLENRGEYVAGVVGGITLPIVTFSTPMRASPTVTALTTVGGGNTVLNYNIFNRNGIFYAYALQIYSSTTGYTYRYETDSLNAEL